MKKILGGSRVSVREPMYLHTSMRVGGSADLYLRPRDEVSLMEALCLLDERQIPCHIMGAGTNIVVRDGGIRGAVLQIGKDMDAISSDMDSNSLTAGAGAQLAAVAKYAAQKGLSGLEPMSGIPGTVGGALFMNAGAYGGEMSQVVTRARVYDRAAHIVRTISVYEMRLGYRSSIFQAHDEYIILSVMFSLKRKDIDSIKSKMRQLAKRRNSKQPMDMPSAGSFFKRPAGAFAGALIERAGLKGLSCGGAMVSEKHAGFIVNTGGAKASDVLALMRRVQDAVRAESGHELEPEPRIIGEDV
ncbi:MAG: UDP-N-acetylmuramate dehydrogenase [Clostridiales Family XIII bacterium]|nr:UDP-N-acetylmuramate dehydrogenase [Clostridiales Family XIII bacterium]